MTAIKELLLDLVMYYKIFVMVNLHLNGDGKIKKDVI